MNLFTIAYKSCTGSMLKIQVTNLNPKKDYSREHTSEELVKRVTKLCKYDIEIYQSVKTGIDQQSK